MPGVERSGPGMDSGHGGAVIVTTFDLDEYVYGALRAGAVGFVLKGASPALLAEAVRAAHTGDALISPQITLRLLRHVAPAKAPPARRPVAPLSEREIEVVRAIAKGRTNAEIGADLFISLSTVKSHLASIQNKLGVRNRAEVAGWAWETGLVQPAADLRRLAAAGNAGHDQVASAE